jgi:hypothetical protein
MFAQEIHETKLCYIQCAIDDLLLLRACSPKIDDIHDKTHRALSALLAYKAHLIEEEKK